MGNKEESRCLQPAGPLTFPRTLGEWGKGGEGRRGTSSRLSAGSLAHRRGGASQKRTSSLGCKAAGGPGGCWVDRQASCWRFGVPYCGQRRPEGFLEEPGIKLFHVAQVTPGMCLPGGPSCLQ